MLETTFQTKVLSKLRKIPKTWWVKVNDKATVGVPDILGCVGNRFFALELKTQTRLSELQHYNLERIDACGSESFVVTPENFEEIFAYILEISKHGIGKKPARIPIWTLPRLREKF